MSQNLRNAFKLVVAFCLFYLTAIPLQLSIAQLNAELDGKSFRQFNGIGRLSREIDLYKKFPNKYDYIYAVGRSYEKLGYEQQAYDYMRKAVSTRPTWPYAWYALLKIQIALENFQSPEFTNTLRNSLQLSKYNNSMRRKHLDIAFYLSGKSIHSDTISLIEAVISRESNAMPGYVKILAYRLRKEEVICSKNGLHNSLQKWCSEIVRYRNICEGVESLHLGQWQYCDKFKKFWDSR